MDTKKIDVSGLLIPENNLSAEERAEIEQEAKRLGIDSADFRGDLLRDYMQDLENGEAGLPSD